MRARYPDETGFVERDGVRVFWESYGEHGPTILLMPTWSIVHSRCWKGQIPYLSRHYRVVTFDGRGNGRSDRPRAPELYREQEFAADADAVLDATASDDAVVVCLSRGIERSLHLAASRPERVRGIFAIGPAVPLPPASPRAGAIREFLEPPDSREGWGKWNAAYWLEGPESYADFLEFFFSQAFTEPHSTRQREDSVAWGLDTDAETLVATQLAPRLESEAEIAALLARIESPMLVLHGRDDAIRPHDSGARLAALAGGRLVSIDGYGHCPQARKPVKVNLLIREFVDSLPARTATRAASVA